MIRIVAPVPEQIQAISDLAAKVFSRDGYYPFYDHCMLGYIQGSSYDWQASRIAMDGEAIVGHVGVWEYRMRVGQARLRTGGLGIVMTHDRYRKQGLNARTCQATMQAMAEQGYDYSMLFGISDYYHRFGFAQAWPELKVFAQVGDLPDVPLALQLAEVPVAEALCGQGEIMAMYNRDNAARTGTAERPIYRLTQSPLWANLRCHSLANDQGRIVGYVACQKEGQDLAVLEVGGLGDDCGLGQILAAIREITKANDCNRVFVSCHSYEHPLVQALRLGNCRMETWHRRSGGAMGATVDLRRCLLAMQEELGDRLGRSTQAGFCGSLTLAGEGQSVSLELAAGRVRVAEKAIESADVISAGILSARLILGAEEPAVLALQGVKYSGQALALALAIFPKQWPMLNRLDGY